MVTSKMSSEKKELQCFCKGVKWNKTNPDTEYKGFFKTTYASDGNYKNADKVNVFLWKHTACGKFRASVSKYVPKEKTNEGLQTEIL